MNTELRILILEDVPEDVELIKRELKRQKIQYSSQAVDNRKDFIAALEEFAPDIVLADQKLPTFDGLSALDIVKEKFPDIPFVFVTGTMGEELAVNTMKRGASDYVLKDKLFRLGPAVRRALREKQEETKRKELEKAIRNAAEEWRITFDSMAEGVSIHTIDGEITRANKALSSLLGLSFREIIGKKCYRLFHTTDDFHESCPMLKSVASKQTEIFEFYEPHVHRWLSVFCSPLLDSDGEVSGVIHTVQDITERKENEKEIRHLNVVLRSIRKVNQLITRETDPECLLEEACRILVESQGYVNAWIARLDKSNAVISVHGAGFGNEFTNFRDWLQEGNKCRFGWETLKKSGVHIVRDPGTECTDCPLAASYNKKNALVTRMETAGAVWGLLVVSSPETFTMIEEEQRLFKEMADDIGFALYSIELEEKRKQAEKALESSETRYRTLFESAAEGILIADIQTKKFRYANHAISNMLGYSVDELIGMGVEDIHPREEIEHVISEFEAQARGEKKLAPNLPCLRKDGKIIYANISTTKALIDGIECNIGFFTDVTERMKGEEEIRNLAKFPSENPNPVMRVTTDGTIIYANKAALNCMNVWKCDINQPLPEKLRELLVDVVSSGVYKTFEINLADKVFSITFMPVLDSGYVNVYGLDITERKNAEEELRASEEKFRDIIDNSFDVIYSVDAQTEEFRYLSPNFERLFGYSMDDIMGMGGRVAFLSNAIGNGFTSMRSQFSRMKAGDATPSGISESWWTIKSGERHYILDSWRAIYKGGKFLYTSGILRDITERKRAEEALQESEELFRLFMEHSPIYVFMKDEKIRSIRLSKNYEKMLGKPIQELLGKDMDELFPAELAKSMMEDDLRILRDGKPIEVIEELNGRVYTTTKFPIIKKGKPSLLAGFTIDITERKKAEEERIRLQIAVEQLHEPVIIHDKDMAVQYVNTAFEETTGYAESEMIGKIPRFLATDENGPVYESISETIQSGDSWSGRIDCYTKEGSQLLCDITVTPVFDDSGDIINFISVIRDLTQEFLMEKRLRQAQRIEAIGTLAGGIAHDFNNILTSIIGFAELSMEEVLKDSQVYDDLSKIYRAGGRAKDLITQILTFSRQHEEERKPINIVPIVKEVLKLIRSTLPSTIEITHAIDSHCGTIMGDPSQVHQIVMNLCTNAGHAMQEDVGILDVTLNQMYVDDDFAAIHPGLKTGAHIKLSVSDTGHGMTPEIIEHIFEPYFTTKEKTGGTGLGLAVVHGIVNSYDGVITVYSKPGVGTTFNVYLPVIPEEAQESEDRIEELPTGSERILFVDDEQNIVEIAERILTGLGYDVTAATSSTEALDLFMKAPDRFDLVISDMTMPKITGDQMARKMLKMRKDIPIIICTGYSERIMTGKVEGIGIRSILMKPLNKSDLARTVRNILDTPVESS